MRDEAFYGEAELVDGKAPSGVFPSIAIVHCFWSDPLIRATSLGPIVSPRWVLM